MTNKDKAYNDYRRGMAKDDIAKKYGVSLATVYNWAKRANWEKEREQYGRDINDKAARKDVDAYAEIMSNMSASALALSASIRKSVEDDEQYHRYIVSETNGIDHAETVEKRFEKRDSKMMRDLVESLNKLNATMRSLYGIQTPAEIENQRIAAERLKLEKEKWEHEKAKEAHESDNVVRVVFDDDVEDMLK